MFAAWNALTGNQRPDGSPVVPFTQTILDGLTVAQHAIEFAAIATRRGLAGDGYHDITGVRLWTQSRHDVLYSHPSLGTKSQVIAHLGAIVNRKQIPKTDVDTAPTVTYEGRLTYYTGLKTTFDGYVDYAQETYTATPTQVHLDYLNAYIEYSSYLLVATNYPIRHLAPSPDGGVPEGKDSFFPTSPTPQFVRKIADFNHQNVLFHVF